MADSNKKMPVIVTRNIDTEQNMTPVETEGLDFVAGDKVIEHEAGGVQDEKVFRKNMLKLFTKIFLKTRLIIRLFFENWLKM